MKQYTAKSIRNIVLVGHAGAGKTSLVEAAYYLTGQADRLGRVADGTTVSDFDPEEVARKASVSMSVVPVEWQETKMNLFDTPGLFDFSGGVSEGVRAAGSALIVVSGKSGLEVGAEKGFAAAAKKGIAKLFFINCLDSENADFYKVYQQLKDAYGRSLCPLVIPHVVNHRVECYINLIENRAYRYHKGQAEEVPIPALGEEYDRLKVSIDEAIAESSEELMDKYFSGEPFTPEERIIGLAKGVRRGEIAPVFCGSAYELEAVDQLLNGLIWLAPWAESVAGEDGTDAAGETVTLTVDENEKTVAIVFKSVVDPFVGKLLYFKVISGKVTADSTLKNTRTGTAEKIGKLFYVRGKKQIETACVPAGDVGAVAKLAETQTGDTLCDPSFFVTLRPVEFDSPCLSMAVSAKKKGDEEKMASGLLRLCEEDPTAAFVSNKETKESVLSGLGEQHLDVLASKLKAKFGVEIELRVPKVPYRETIRKKVKVQGRHKKQSGGHGQYGDVWIEFEPCESEGLEFAESVFGGSVPKNFFPAVEKGLHDSAKHGVLAGFPMVGVKATLVDGSYHPVDSSEMAFKTAAQLAYKAGIPQAQPVLLEPIGLLQVFVPGDYTGDVMGDINKRRGRVLGMNPLEDDPQITCVEAEVPMAQVGDLATALRSMTQGRGRFTLAFDHYEEAPAPVAQKVIEAYKAEEA